MSLRDEWRERVTEVVAEHECLYERRVYPAFECSCGEWHGAQGDDGSETDGRNDNADAYRNHLADQLLAPGGVVAGIVAEAWRASRLDIAYELRESGAWAEVRMAEWVEMRADREALKAAQNPPSDGRARSGEGAGPSDGAEGVERGEG